MTGTAENAIRVFGDMHDQTRGSDGSIAITKQSGGGGPLMPGSSSKAVMSKRNRSHTLKGKGLTLAAIPASLLVMNHYYGRRKTASSRDQSKSRRRSAGRKSARKGRGKSAKR
jgi:hypothetical protein